jgi:hypothetical protein
LTATVADFTALAALSTTNKLAGDLAFVVEGEVYMSWTGTVWRQTTTATFATTGARDTAYAKASAQFRIARVRALDTASNTEFIFTGAAWVTGPTNLATATFTGLALTNGATVTVPQAVSVPAVPWARVFDLHGSQVIAGGTSAGAFLSAGFVSTAGTIGLGTSGGSFNLISNFSQLVHTVGILTLPANTAAVVSLQFVAGGLNISLSGANGLIRLTAPGP